MAQICAGPSQPPQNKKKKNTCVRCVRHLCHTLTLIHSYPCKNAAHSGPKCWGNATKEFKTSVKSCYLLLAFWHSVLFSTRSAANCNIFGNILLIFELQLPLAFVFHSACSGLLGSGLIIRLALACELIKCAYSRQTWLTTKAIWHSYSESNYGIHLKPPK